MVVGVHRNVGVVFPSVCLRTSKPVGDQDSGALVLVSSAFVHNSPSAATFSSHWSSKTSPAVTLSSIRSGGGD